MSARPSFMQRVGLQLSFVVPDPADIRTHAPIVVPFIIAVLMHIVGANLFRGSVADALVADQASASTANLLLSMMVILSPVLILIRTLVMSLMTWAILVLLSTKSRFRALVSIHLYGAMLLAIPAIVSAIILRFRGVDELEGPGDLLVPLGLDLVLDPGSSPTMIALTQQASVFHGLWVVLMVWLLSASAGASRKTSVIAALSLWGLSIGYSMLRAVLFTL